MLPGVHLYMILLFLIVKDGTGSARESPVSHLYSHRITKKTKKSKKTLPTIRRQDTTMHTTGT